MKKSALFLALILCMGIQVIWAQTRQITGTVTNAEDGDTMPGVSVTVKGTTIGTITDMDGKYLLEVPTDAEVLVFTFVGMRKQEMPITGNVIDVALEQDVIGVEEVVVTAIGIRREQKTLGFSATEVNNEDITRTRESSVVTGLQGKVAGVEITSSSSDPGSSNSVIIRGVSSITGTNQPLYVVDGVPLNNRAQNSVDGLNGSFDFGNGANAINPDDVESMTVLKGAAATALYGSRAANGVIVITTKSGKQSIGKFFGVTYNTSYTVSNVLRLPDFQNTFGQGWNGQHYLDENGSWGPKFDGQDRLWGREIDNSQQIKPFVALEDNLYDFFEYGTNYQSSVSLSGGSGPTKYFLSHSYVKNDGIYPGDADSYKRHTIGMRGEHSVRMIRLSSALNYTNSKNKFVPTGQGLTVYNSLMQIPRDLSIIDMEDYNDKFYNVDNFYTPYGITNPYYVLNEYGNTYNMDKVFGKIQLDIDFTDYLSFTYRLGGDVEAANRHLWNAITIPAEGSPNYNSSTNDPGRVRKAHELTTQINHDFLLTYFKDFSEDWNLNAFVGYNINQREYKRLQVEINQLDIPGFYHLTNSSNPLVLTNLTTTLGNNRGDYQWKRRLLGLFGQAEVGWKEMIYLTLSARNDWSSTLPKDNKSFFYPGATLSWLFTELLSESARNVMSFGKIRAAYGQTGNDADPYLIDPVFVQGSIYQRFRTIDFPLQGQNAFEVGNTLGNQSLSPEITTELELGADLRLLNNRLGVDFTWYNRSTKDQIYTLPLPPSTGFTSQTLNLGEIENKGIEVLVTGTPLKIDDFTWDIAVNFAKNDNLVISLAEGLDKISLGGTTTISHVAVVGQPLGLIEASVPMYDPEGRIIVDGNGMPKANPQKQILGQTAFDWIGGFNTTLRFRGWQLYAGFDIRKGGLIYSRTSDINHFVGNLPQTTYNDRRPFIVPNSVVEVLDEDGTTVIGYEENLMPIRKDKMDDFHDIGGVQRDGSFVLDRSYGKFRELSISYDFPRKMLSETPFQTIQLSLIGRNLALWTANENNVIDPEASTFGNDLRGRYGEFSANPTTKSFGFNLKLSF